MRAAWYKRHGPAREVLQFGEMLTPEPGPGELRVKVAAAVVHVSDLGKRAGSFGAETRSCRPERGRAPDRRRSTDGRKCCSAVA